MRIPYTISDNRHGHTDAPCRQLNLRFWAIALCSVLVAVTSIRQGHAGDLSLILNGVAKHKEERKKGSFNEENWGAGLQYDYGNETDEWISFATLSGFLDSNSEPSYYAGGGIARRFILSKRFNNLHFDAGAIAFLMTRKDRNNGSPFPGALPVFSLGTRQASLNIIYIPKVTPKMVALWFFQLKISTKNFW